MRVSLQKAVPDNESNSTGRHAEYGTDDRSTPGIGVGKWCGALDRWARGDAVVASPAWPDHPAPVDCSLEGTRLPPPPPPPAEVKFLHFKRLQMNHGDKAHQFGQMRRYMTYCVCWLLRNVLVTLNIKKQVT